MATSFLQVMISLGAGIGVILILTMKFHVHAFFALMMACIVTGLGVQFSIPETLALVKDGFGNIMKSLALIIILGTTLGVLLEHNGSTRTMADFILKMTGERRPALAMSVAGLVVGLPIFCDSGYIVLSGLNRQLAKRTGISVIPMAVSLATGLYSVHCLVPPHPGASAAAAALQVDFGRLILWGVIVAIPSMVVGHLWSVYASKKILPALEKEHINEREPSGRPSAIMAFLPVIVPIALIAIRSFLGMEEHDKGGRNILMSLGDPVVALSIGVLLAFFPKCDWKKDTIRRLLQESVEKAGSILVIIGAGGAFGAVLAATKPGDHFSEMAGLKSISIVFPFLLTMILKTAQGSSTVAIITAASIVQSLLPALGMDTANGHLLAVLAMGAGSMTISHANDAYFWVIVKFSGIDMKSMLRVYSLATLWMGLTALVIVYFLSLILS